MFHFKRELQRYETDTGTNYRISIPRPVAEALKLEGGGLCSIEIRYNGEIIIESYADSPHPTIDVFDPSRVHSGDGTYGYVRVEARPPPTKGPSRGFPLYDATTARDYLASVRAALRFIKLDRQMMYGSRRRRRH